MNNFSVSRLCAFVGAAFFSITLQTSHAQSVGVTPKDMTEFGVNAGYLFVAGDVKQEPGYAVGLHFRKATDYLFSVRLDANLGKANGNNNDNSLREFEMDWLGFTGFGVFSLNNVRFDRSVKKANYYVMAGGGGNLFNTEFKSFGQDGNPRQGTVDKELAAHVSVGGGLSFRLSNKVNIGIEHTASFVFGQRGDKIDGINFDRNQKSIEQDIVNFTSLQINFNLGNSASRVEPLFWTTPGNQLIAEIDDLKKRQDTAISDSDGDGVIDAIDQEPDTPSDAPVDTKGRTLDSDKDGIADYKDLEPYYPPRAGETVNEDGVVVNPIAPANSVTEERVQQMIDEALSKYGLSEQKSAVAEWFLPMIHFATDSYSIKYSDYGNLASIARMMKSNPGLRLVVTGFTDQTGSEGYNEGLSYQRANAIVEHLTNQHGIARGRLIIEWKGQQEALVPSTASYMNRRVEFRAATNADVEMDPPSGTKLNTTDGY